MSRLPPFVGPAALASCFNTISELLEAGNAKISARVQGIVMQTAPVQMKRGSQTARRTSLALLAMLMFAIMCRNLHALILADGDGTGNTTVPADDPGWSNVGRYGDFTATYLGNGWAIAADHVPLARQIVFGQLAVPILAGSEVTLAIHLSSHSRQMPRRCWTKTVSASRPN